MMEKTSRGIGCTNGSVHLLVREWHGLGGCTLDQIPLVGRKKELDQLNNRLAEADHGHSQLVWVSGDGGLGKTFLVDNFVRDAEEKGWAAVRCHARMLGAPFHPFIDMLRQVAAAPVFSDESAGHRGRWLDLLHSKAPSVLELVGIEGTDASIEEPLFDQLVTMITSYAEEVPLIVVLEDFSVADESSCFLIERLVSGIGKHMLMVVLIAQDPVPSNESNPLYKMLDKWEDRRRMIRLDLELLTKDEMVQIIDYNQENNPIPEELSISLIRAARGRPLGLVMGPRIAQVLVEGDRPLPTRTNLEGMLTALLATLNPRHRQLLELLAAAEGPASLDLLSIASGLEEWDLESTLGWMAEGGLVDHFPDSGEYYVASMTLRSLIYWRATSKRRENLHQRLALAYEEVSLFSPRPFEQFHHLQLSRQVVPLGQIVRGVLEMAMAVHANPEARLICHQALDLLPEEGNQELIGHLTFQLVTLEYTLGNYPAALQACQYFMSGPGAGRGRQGWRIDALLMAGKIHAQHSEYDEAGKAFREARSLSEKMGDHSRLSRSWRSLGDLLWFQGEYEGATKRYEQALQQATTARDPVNRLWATALMARNLVEQGQLRVAREKLQECISQARRLDEPEALVMSLLYLGWVMFCENDLKNALTNYYVAVRLARRHGLARLLGATLAQAGEVQALLNNLDLATNQVMESLDIFERLEDNYGLCTAYRTQAHILFRQGEADVAHQILTKALELARKSRRPDALALTLFYRGRQTMESNPSGAQGDLKTAEVIFNEMGNQLFAKRARTVLGQLYEGRRTTVRELTGEKLDS